MNNITKFSKCAYCGACLNICPKDAISVDKSGYFYTLKVDDQKCINCGKCVNICPLNSGKTHLDVKAAYGGWHNDDTVVRSSTSGGAFTALADYVMKRNGVVYGAAYSDDCKEVLTLSTDETPLDNIKRSKYVESSVHLSFRKIKKDLEDGKYVLFCGTPCQVAGLHSYLGNDYEKLITADFACGGLASHKLYEEKINALEKKYHSKTTSVNFRAGIYGWKTPSIQMTFANRRKYRTHSFFDSYMYAFMYSRYGIRDNCLECMFRDTHYSDFIISDFWEYNDYSNLVNDERGISLILTNSDKAENIMSEISKVMHLEKLDINKAMYNCYPKPPARAEFLQKRDTFFKTAERDGLEAAAKEAGMVTGLKAFVTKLKIAICSKRIMKK